MSDTGDSSVSLDWAIVDHEGSIPDDATSTASSVEVVDDDDEEEESFDSHGTPLAGSPNNNMPRFVLRLPSRSAQNVSDTDDEPSDISNMCMNAEASIVSLPESLPSSSGPSVSSSEHDMAGQTYRQSSTARISREDIEDLCDKIDTLKKTLVPARKEEDISSLDIIGDGRLNSAGTSHESDMNLPRVENLRPSESPDDDTSMQSSVNSSFSFLSRDTATEARTEKAVETDAVNREPEPLLVEQLLAQQEPATQDDVAWEPSMEEQEQEPENLNDMLQVEQGQHYLQTFVSYVIDYRDIIRWVIGFGSYTGFVVATVIYFSAPASVPPCQSMVPKESHSISDLSTGPQYCHGDECSSGPDKKHLDDLMRHESIDRIKKLKDWIEADAEYIGKLTRKQEQQEVKIRATKIDIESLQLELNEIRTEKDILEDRKESAIDGWKKEWQDGLLKVAELQKLNLALETELTDTTHDKDHLEESLRLCRSQMATEELDKIHDAELAKQAEMKLDVFRKQCKNDIDNIEGRCKSDLDNVRGQYQTDIDRVNSQCQSDLSNVRFEHHVNLENLKSQHKVDMDNLKWQSDEDVRKAHRSCQKLNHDKQFKRSAHGSEKEQSDHDRTSYNSHTQAGDKDGDDKEESRENIPFSFAQWTGTVLEMMNSTKHQIKDTWAKVKNVSESLWQEHEPTIRNLQQSFTKKIVRLNEKFQEKLARKLNKWFGRKKKQGGAGKTRRREFEKDHDSGSPPTIEQRLVKQSYRVNDFTAKTFRKTYKKNIAKLESIQAEFKDIDGTMKIPKTYEEKIKWKDYILTDQHLRWLRCQQKFWEDFMKAPDDCFKELCCWQVKIADGNVKACRQYKRRHGIVEDQCSLELPKETVSADNDDDDDDDQDEENKDKENWYFEMAEDRDYQRTEPDDWFFRRNNKAPSADRKTPQKSSLHDDDTDDQHWDNYDDVYSDDVYVTDDDDDDDDDGTLTEAHCPVMREFSDCGTVTSDSTYEAHPAKHRFRRSGKVTPMKAATLRKRFKERKAANKESPSKRTEAKSKKKKRNKQNKASSTTKSSEQAAKNAATKKVTASKKTVGKNKKVKSSSEKKPTTKKTAVPQQSTPKNKKAESPRKPNTAKRAAATKQATAKNTATKSATKSATPKRSTAAKQATPKNVAAKTASRAKPAAQKQSASSAKRSSRSRR